MPAQPTPRVLLFDVNEPLLDAGALKTKIGDLLQDPSGGALRFTTMLHYSLVMSASGQYAAFPEIGAATLQMLARNSEVVLDPGDAAELIGGMRSLPPHPDVIPALERLKKAGMRMATLTNSSSKGVAAQLEHAGIAQFFELQLSVEALGK